MGTIDQFLSEIPRHPKSLLWVDFILTDPQNQVHEGKAKSFFRYLNKYHSQKKGRSDALFQEDFEIKNMTEFRAQRRALLEKYYAEDAALYSRLLEASKH